MPFELPYFPFYPAEFLTDVNVVLMTNEQIGCYIKLLCYQWREGSIPQDEAKIALLLGVDSLALARLKPGLTERFPDGINPRLNNERERAIRQHELLSQCGKRGISKRFPKKLGKTARLKPGLSNGTAQPGLSTRVSLSILKEYFSELKSTEEEAVKFYDHFESNGWKIGGRAQMKDWRAAARNWVRRSGEFKGGQDKAGKTPVGGVRAEPGKYDERMAEAAKGSEL